MSELQSEAFSGISDIDKNIEYMSHFVSLINDKCTCSLFIRVLVISVKKNLKELPTG